MRSHLKSQWGNDPFLNSYKLLVEFFSSFFFFSFNEEEVCSFRTKGGLLLQCCCQIKINRRSAANLSILNTRVVANHSYHVYLFLFFGSTQGIGPDYAQRRGTIEGIMLRGCLRILLILYRTQTGERSAFYPVIGTILEPNCINIQNAQKTL